MKIPRMMIAGSASGVGKTTTVVALTRAFQKRGLNVVVFKCGPDYLDPTYHELATGKKCHNLDPWMMGRESVLSTFKTTVQDADLVLIEGVMGLYDGLKPDSNVGGTAEISQWLEAPVLTVMDASGMSRTIAAIFKGLKEFDPKTNVVGLIANFVGSQNHLSLLRTAMSPFPIVGGFPKNSDQAFPERHLGLYAAEESTVTREKFEFWGSLCEQWFNLDQILQIAQDAPAMPESISLNLRSTPSVVGKISTTRCRIGIAKDEAFHFYYEENLRLLADLGADLIYFSPLKDIQLPEVDGIYIGGGYPEVHGKALSSNHSMIDSIRKFHSNNRPIYAECGGLMYLTDEMILCDGRAFPGIGLISGKVYMRNRLQALGYVEVVTEEETLLGPAGTRFRGHQFRYSEFFPDFNLPMKCCYKLRKRSGSQLDQEGYLQGSLLASYVHGHWASNPSIASHFVRACLRER